jgi:thioesterase III
MIFEHRKRVYGFECDVYGHLNNANYLQILESARAEALIEMGMSVSRMRELNLQIFIRAFELDYRKAIDLEDIITVSSWFDEVNKVKGSWTQQILNSGGEVCFQARMLAVFASEGHAHRLPQEVYDLFLSFLESDRNTSTN